MKVLRYTIPLFVILISGLLNQAIGQGQILSLTPNMGTPGQTTDIIIRCSGTAFKPGTTKVDFGSDITVNSVSVQNTTTLDVQITISATAVANPSGATVTITSGSNVLNKPNGFQIFKAGANVTATMTVTPVQSLHISDFDPKNIANSPLLFTVSVFNDASVRDLEAVLTVSGQTIGSIGRAIKVNRKVSANMIYRFDNRQFDKYEATNASSPAIQTAIQTGVLPSDVYMYHISIIDMTSNSEVAVADGSNIISNALNKPELIGPGNPFFADPITIHIQQPVFQWFSQGNNFDFYVYEVKDGQKTKEEIALNQPFYFIKGLVGTSYLYPASARIMQNGKVYAWQIIANYSGTNGSNSLSSDIFWFTMGTSSTIKGNQTANELKINPDQTTLSPGQSFKFSTKAFDVNNDSVPVKPTWSVVPAEGGTIDANGYFTAGAGPNTVAVKANAWDLTDYATVNITAGSIGNSGTGILDLEKMVKQMYGLK